LYKHEAQYILLHIWNKKQYTCQSPNYQSLVLNIHQTHPYFSINIFMQLLLVAQRLKIVYKPLAATIFIMKIASLFSGCGGLDLGFTQAGFEVIYANDNASFCWETFEKNHHTKIDRRSIINVKSEEIPDVDGIIGGPPCQSWSLAGAMRGIKDQRGQLFYEYLRILKDKKPKFFLAENVPGIISKTHKSEFEKILREFEKVGKGYNVNYKILNSADYGVPQERKRVFVIGLRKDLGKTFEFPKPTHSKDGKENKWVSLRKTIGDLPESIPAEEKNKTNLYLKIDNHEHMNGGFSTIYMSRNRRKSWEDPSFTIQAGGRHAPLHPDSTKMIKLGSDKWGFEGDNSKHRRLSVRECARIQTFPDNFKFYYNNISDGYKMIGNAVPVKLANKIALNIFQQINRNE
jgi:DNA (cytosine-5)-methyltransferase 1